MDLKGTLVDTKLKIYPAEQLIFFIKSLPADSATPENILKIAENDNIKSQNQFMEKPAELQLNTKDLENLNRIKQTVNKYNQDIAFDKEKNGDFEDKENKGQAPENKALNGSDDFIFETKGIEVKDDSLNKFEDNSENDLLLPDVETDKGDSDNEPKENYHECREGPYLLTSDLDWLYVYLQKMRSNKDNIPYLHELLEGAEIETPENKVIKRNPVLEARCVKLRAQQEAREYRKMTKTVDNVRMKYPEDSISYQLKHINRHLIAIGQFIISIFAGFLFGFRGVEWMVGNLDFGFRLLLGVMCALVIALAEIYFLAKKLNEELNIMETVQLGGPTKFSNEVQNGHVAAAPTTPPPIPASGDTKEHQD